ncbi:MAG: redoxin domain-containing protein [Betaproteobacteria bacterium]|nr:redoxin domain-containing protein [Betaproteobacteria bacterium]
MTPVSVGQPAPPFRLPAAAGGELGPQDYLGKSNLIVWFTKGMGCPFCRQQMSQLARGYGRFRKLNAELLEVTVTKPERARFYARNFRLPFPYLCDPDYAARRAWGLDWRSHSPLWYASSFVAGARMPMPENDFGKFLPALGEWAGVLADDDMGFFILDRDGTVRHAVSGSYASAGGVHELPANDEIERVLERCERSAAGVPS